MVSTMVGAFAAFISGMAVDVGWVWYIRAAAAGDAVQAAAASMLVGGAAALGVLAAASNYSVLPFYIAGLGAGSYAAVRFLK